MEPTNNLTDNTPFDWFGDNTDSRQAGVRQLVDIFYDEMDQNDAFKRIRDLHPRDLTESRDKFYLFLVGWLGGPDLYQPQFGHPRLRARHMPFPIASEDRDQWLRCMLHALRAVSFSEDQIQTLMLSFFKTADWMRNQPDHADPSDVLPILSKKGHQAE
ncbi:MAG: group II truncated hemoglobin [Limnobacter sp.]|nr:group II truncated hemoglobin [Limnobacter sp.]